MLKVTRFFRSSGHPGFGLLVAIAIAACSGGLKMTDARDAALDHPNQANTAGEVGSDTIAMAAEDGSSVESADGAAVDAESSPADSDDSVPQVDGRDGAPDMSAERPGTDACINPVEGEACVDGDIPCPTDPCLGCERWECSDGQWYVEWVCGIIC